MDITPDRLIKDGFEYIYKGPAGEWLAFKDRIRVEFLEEKFQVLLRGQGCQHEIAAKTMQDIADLKRLFCGIHTEPEPITAAALESEGWREDRMFSGLKTKAGGGWQPFLTVNTRLSPPHVFITFNDSAGTIIRAKATTMTHIRALEEMFLS